MLVLLHSAWNNNFLGHEHFGQQNSFAMKDKNNKITLLALACVCCSSYALLSGSTTLKQARKSPEMRLDAIIGNEDQTSSDTKSVHSSTRRKNTRLQMVSVPTAERKQVRKKTKTSRKIINKATPNKDTLQNMAADSVRTEMMNHKILTRDQDFDLGRKVQRANRLKESIMRLIDDKLIEQSYSQTMYQDFDEDPIDESLFFSSGHILEDVPNPLSLRSSLRSSLSEYLEPSSFDEEYDKLKHQFRLDHLQNRYQMPATIVDHLDDSLLSDDDIIFGLDLSGGRDELRQILLNGALARDELIRCNVKLVVSIAKKWARNSARMTSSDGGHKLAAIYSGSSTRPSLDEAIQEGIVGLVRAVDRYDANKEFRFSTYATYWITNQVRICFQRASTGCLRVPSPYHDIKSRYKKIIRRCVETNTPVPPEDELAIQVGVTLSRMRRALRNTRPLISLDAPLHAGMGASRGSNAGGDGVGERQVLVSDILECEERRPEEQVELSLLRQCLENAMATELSPHERDVIRLRLGLDDGVARSAREVVEVCGGCISVAEVRNAEKRAYRKMASPFAVHTGQLLSYLDFAGGDIQTITE